MILDATKDDAQRQMLTKELNDVGIRLNKERPKISVTKTPLGVSKEKTLRNEESRRL